MGTVPPNIPVAERTDGAVEITLAAGATVTLYSAAGGAAPPASFTVKPSAGNASQANSWGWPSFHGIPPPPPPPPPPTPCQPKWEVAGYTCHNNRCGDDSFKVRAQCGADLCWPTMSNASLCGVVHGKDGTTAAVAAAAARCTSVGHGCKSFGMTPDGTWTGASASGCVVVAGSSTCAKWFSNSGDDFLTPATDWVMWTRDK